MRAYRLIALLLTTGLSIQSSASLAFPVVAPPPMATKSGATNPFANEPTNEQSLRLEISLSHRQVTLYRGSARLKSYPVAIGRPGWETPIGSFRVIQMIKDPIWEHPFTGEKVPGGDPENPLGHYWIGFWTNGKNWIGFHGTPTPRSVGRPASHGCIRMYNKDVEELFHQVKVGTEVVVVK